MTLAVEFSAEAADEVEEAMLWYENRRDGLGSAFLDSVDEAISDVAMWPQSGAMVQGLSHLAVRRLSIGRFPYHLAYIQSDNSIHILAVAHDKRQPGYWASRRPN